MPYDQQKHHRRSIRLPGHDYTSAGAYFVTICVHGGECLLGEVVDGAMRLSEFGQIAAESWQWMDLQYPYVSLDAWVIMRNHMHGIIVMRAHAVHSIDGGGGGGRGGSRTAPTGATPAKRKALGRLVGPQEPIRDHRPSFIIVF